MEMMIFGSLFLVMFYISHEICSEWMFVACPINAINLFGGIFLDIRFYHLSVKVCHLLNKARDQ